MSAVQFQAGTRRRGTLEKTPIGRKIEKRAKLLPRWVGCARSGARVATVWSMPGPSAGLSLYEPGEGKGSSGVASVA
jgi:hypothetical protein